MMIKASPSISEVEKALCTCETPFFPEKKPSPNTHLILPPPESSYIKPSSSQKNIIYTVQFTCCIDIRNHLFICIDDLRAHFIDHSYILMIYPKKEACYYNAAQRESLQLFKKGPSFTKYIYTYKFYNICHAGFIFGQCFQKALFWKPVRKCGLY